MARQQNKPTTQQMLTMQRVHQGPLPTPEDLAHYNDIEPGLANRIMLMAEEQSNHRQSIELIAVRAGAWNNKWGLISGFFIGMTSIICGTWIISIGKSSEGLATIISSLVALVGVFVYGKYKTQKELEKKRNG